MVMLCQVGTEKQLDSNNHYYQVKYDGERCLYLNGKLVNRRQVDMTFKYPEIKIVGNCWLDGELCILDAKGKSDFSKVALRTHLQNPTTISERSKTMPVTFVVFDVLKWNGENLMSKPLTERKKYLELVKGNHIKIADYFENGKALWETVKKCELEGVVAKHKSSPYEWNTRSALWLKIKNVHEATIRFNAYEVHPKGITLCDDKGTRCACNGEQSQQVRTTIDQKGSVEVVCQYLNLTESGAYRQITFKGET